MTDYNFSEDEEFKKMLAMNQEPTTDFSMPQPDLTGMQTTVGTQQAQDQAAVMQQYRDNLMTDIANNRKSSEENKLAYEKSQEAGSGLGGGISKGLAVLGDTFSAIGGNKTDYTKNLMGQYATQKKEGESKYKDTMDSGIKLLDKLSDVDKKQLVINMSNPKSKESITAREQVNKIIGTPDNKTPLGPDVSAVQANNAYTMFMKNSQMTQDQRNKAEDFSIKRLMIDSMKEKNLNKPGTSEQNLAAGYAKRMEEAQGIFDKVAEEGFDSTSRLNQMAGILPTEMQPDNKLKQEQAELNFITAVLRKESGANIPEKELATEKRKYFPPPGSSPEVVAQYRNSREQAIQNLIAAGGSSYDRIKTAGGTTPKQPSLGTQIPSIGTVLKGHKFEGGDPNNVTNWVKVN